MTEVRSVVADIPPATRSFIEECSLTLFERLSCRDYARFDWRLDAHGEPHLLEANPNPGWCWDGHMAKQAAHAGYSYADMLRLIVEAAERRIGSRRNTSRFGDRPPPLQPQKSRLDQVELTAP